MSSSNRAISRRSCSTAPTVMMTAIVTTSASTNFRVSRKLRRLRRSPSFTWMPLDVDPAILGREFDRAAHEPVTSDELISFARALGETAACYTEPGPGLIAHPTYCVRFKGHKFFPDTLPERLRFRMSFDAGKDIQLGEPIRPGDVVTVASTLHEVYEKTGLTGSMVFVVVRFTMMNQRGATVAIVDNRFMYKGLEG